MSKKTEKTETEILTNAGAPEKMSFAEMQKAIAEYKKLQKLIKSLPKEDRAKLMPKRERVITDNIKPLIVKISSLLNEYQENIKSEFKTTVSIEKPNGQKWLTFKLNSYTFCIAINKVKE